MNPTFRELTGAAPKSRAKRKSKTIDNKTAVDLPVNSGDLDSDADNIGLTKSNDNATETRMKKIDIRSIRTNESNPRTISEKAFDKLCKSIERDSKFMELRPIIVDEDGVIIGGNQRYRACVKMGMQELPSTWVVFATNLTPEQRKRFILIDNSPDGMSGEWDVDVLSSEIDMQELLEIGFDKLFNALNVEECVSLPDLQQEKDPFRQMTFNIHEEQYDEITTAISEAKKTGGGESGINPNSNGNALFFICRKFNKNGN